MGIRTYTQVSKRVSSYGLIATSKFWTEVSLVLESSDSSSWLRPVEITDAVPALSNQKQRAQLLAKAKEEIMGFPSTRMDAIAGFVAAFVGDSISLRVLPCGREHLEYAFSGALLGR